jgi:hypothetical protein
MKNISFVCALLLTLALTPTSAYSQRSAGYDGRDPLRCGVNVDCSNKSDVVAKMKIRWSEHSSKTPYSNSCLQAIERVQSINPQIWGDGGLAAGQMFVCNS